MKFYICILLISISFASFGQGLTKQRIWKISDQKKSVYTDKGIFHSSRSTGPVKLNAIRNSYIPKRGYERVVFDFSGARAPKVYGHISADKKKIYFDFYNTNISSNISSIKKVKYVKSVDIFAIDSDLLSAEINLYENVNVDIFYLDSPARVVVDIRK